MDQDLNELLVAAGAVMQHRLNAAPKEVRKKIQDAIEAGGWTELRVGMLNHAATVRVGITNLDGAFAEVYRTEIEPPPGH